MRNLKGDWEVKYLGKNFWGTERWALRKLTPWPGMKYFNKATGKMEGGEPYVSSITEWGDYPSHWAAHNAAYAEECRVQAVIDAEAAERAGWTKL